MNPATIKLRYIPAQFRVRVEFCKAQAMANEAPPQDVIARAKAKLDEEKAKGTLKFFLFYEERFARIWSIVRATAMPDETTIGVTLGTGAPDMPGILVAAPADGQPHSKLTITSSIPQLELWRFDLFKLSIHAQLHELGQRELLDPAHLHLLYYKACRGKKIVEEDLLPLAAIPDAQGTASFDIQVDPRDGVIKIIARDVAAIVHNEHATTAVVNAVIKKARELKDRHGWGFVVLKDAIVRKLRSAGRGPEHYGLDLPLVILGALRRDEDDAGARGEGHVQLKLSDDLLSASIRRVDPSLYEDASHGTLEHWLRFFEGKGLTHGLDEKAVAEFMKRLKTKQSCDGLVLASGTPPIQAVGPKLVAIYQNPMIRDEALGMRDRQATSFVQAGQLVAEIRFETPACAGLAVTGVPIEAENSEIPLVTVGEGIEARGPFHFYATRAGTPVVGDEDISLTPALVLKQNINMVSGNIYFDGPVEILGDIEAGSTVETTGDLIVRGMVEGARIKVGGSLTVDGGIVGGREGSVRVKRDVVAGFFDNARVIAGGNVNVKKSITSSDVSAMGSVVVEEAGGGIVGGHVRAWNEIKATNVGRSTGVPTHLTVGHDVRAESSLAVREKRLGQLQQALKEEKANMRTLKDKAPRELSHKGTRRRARTADRLQHIQQLVDRMVVRVQAVKTTLKYSENVAILIPELLAKTTVITVAGLRVPVKDDMRSVKITKDGGRKAHIVPFENTPASPDKKAG